MAGFELRAGANANNVFLVKHSELEGRWDIDYYRPKINALEKKIRLKTTKKLKDFIVKLASGATPSVQEEAKFYSTKENGIPFLRVQNLNVSGELGLDDVKYINQETHNNYLKRSQVSEHDLLVKITGVGRMAIASVAPTGFVGNTNQHMVVIKTGGEAQSRYLANYLNLDIIEALATRRSTGATRPALDYPALKSIPVIEGIDFSLLKQAETQKQQKEQQAQALLDGIDGYLLNELGIALPQQDNRLEKRMFTVPFSEVTGGRFDPKLYDSITKGIRSAILQATFKTKPLRELITHSSAGDWGMDATNEDNGDYQNCLVIRATEFDNQYNLRLENSRVKYRLIHRKKLNLMDIRVNDLLIEKSGGSIDQPVGRIALLTDEMIREHQLGYSNFIHKIRVDDTRVSPTYLFFYLKLMHNIKLTDSMQSQTNGIRNLIMSNYFNQNIVIPPMGKQTEIATHISQIRTQAKQLHAEAANLLATAKADIERMILGETT
jgi:type I restriction enzyme, S subunit